MYVGLRDFHETYFGDVQNLETTSKTFFEDCLKGSDRVFREARGVWSKEAKQDDVLSWFADLLRSWRHLQRATTPLRHINEDHWRSRLRRETEDGYWLCRRP
ncbi:hypothetical protein GE09DRAFT_1085606 [Coniochaeta sp. 2T2.1]|nr:hypothetical protein GE09DRAFT_1085606 [Coniochaeta sp. 2T2.1]